MSWFKHKMEKRAAEIARDRLNDESAVPNMPHKSLIVDVEPATTHSIGIENLPNIVREYAPLRISHIEELIRDHQERMTKLSHELSELQSLVTALDTVRSRK